MYVLFLKQLRHQGMLSRIHRRIELNVVDFKIYSIVPKCKILRRRIWSDALDFIDHWIKHINSPLSVERPAGFDYSFMKCEHGMFNLNPLIQADIKLDEFLIVSDEEMQTLSTMYVICFRKRVSDKYRYKIEEEFRFSLSNPPSVCKECRERR